MNLKNTLLQVFTIFFLVLIAAKFLVPAVSRTEAGNESTAEQIRLLSERLGRMETQLGKLVPDAASRSTTGPYAGTSGRPLHAWRTKPEAPLL